MCVGGGVLQRKTGTDVRKWKDVRTQQRCERAWREKERNKALTLELTECAEVIILLS